MLRASLTLLLLGLAACSGHATSPSGGDGGGSDSAPTPQIVGLTIEPPSLVIDVVDGVVAPAAFTAIATYDDNTTATVEAEWTFDELTIAQVDAAGTLVARGDHGGMGTLTARLGELGATAAVSVYLHVVHNDAGVSAADQATFDTPDTEPSGTLLYPYDQTVFARGLRAPLLQWDGGAAGDVYRIKLSEPFAEAVLYVTADPPSRAAIPQEVWDLLTEANTGAHLDVSIERLSNGQAHLAMTESWIIAQGSLRGSIYYWAVNTGQLMKIAPGASSPSVVFDSGPADQLGTPTPANYNGATPPWESGGNNKRCVACHTVSKDGSRIASVFERNGSTASPWGTVDLTADPPSLLQLTPYNSDAIFLALTPDGTRAVENTLDMKLHLRDATTGAPIASALDTIADKVADPAFSPDGHTLALASNITGAYPVEYSRADLDLFDYDRATDTFANRRQIAAGGTQAIAFPSFSPDSAWVFYQKGDYSRAKYGTSSVGADDLFMTSVAGGGEQIALANASGAGLEARNQHIAYQPTVNPIAVGGYIWVVFMTPRDYGNMMRSTNNPTYQNRKQLWVAAIDLNPTPGQDPSHPAFWLPGQDLSTINMSGYWSLEACHAEGDSCEQGFECCTGFCQPDAQGANRCVPPPTSGCSHVGEACDSAADCCEPGSHACFGGYCSIVIQ